MRFALCQLLRLATIFLRCVPAFFRNRNEQAIVELALRQQLATFAQKGPKPRITPVDRAFCVEVAAEDARAAWTTPRLAARAAPLFAK